jgi:transcriptional regulator with PAS, ATPase and Fis domain
MVEPSGSNGFSGVQIIGTSPLLLTAIELARRAAPTDMPVLIVGETGTGKELLAQYIHAASGRAGHLVDVDCGALPDDLTESLLFGHRQGAFTGAIDSPRGLIAAAEGGTLFLDELGSLSERGQAKLLRVLETGVVRPVGGTAPRLVDFRLLATAQESLGEMMKAGRVRDDLVQRVAGVVIRLPALRERPEDVELLAEHFAARRALRVSRRAIDLLTVRPWPGNVRQLKWTVMRASLFAADSLVDDRCVISALESGSGALSGVREAATDNGVGALRALCECHAGDADRIAAAIGISKSTLYRRVKQAGLHLRAFKSDARAG